MLLCRENANRVICAELEVNDSMSHISNGGYNYKRFKSTDGSSPSMLFGGAMLSAHIA